MSECLIVGGGVIGLSLAYELAGQGWRVRVIDSGEPGREASWAGAGILPPACPFVEDPLERLTALSNELHRQWSAELLASTGVDTGYHRSGALYVARTATEAHQLDHFAALAHARKIAAQRLTRGELDELEPSLRPSGTIEAVYLVPDECQIRNPRHLKALLIACAGRGVEISSGVAADDFEIRGGRIRAVRTSLGLLSADQICIATGSWSAELAKKLGVSLAIKPIRGQMVLLSLLCPAVHRIVNEGSRYLVPRADGRLLVGSTEEDVGFDRSTTAGAVAGLLQFALSLVPDLAAARVERTWAGLRPATRDAAPYLGRVPGMENAFIAAGHFRSGLQLSTGTARVMSQLIRGQRPEVDLTMFRVDRDGTARDIQSSPKRARHELPLT